MPCALCSADAPLTPFAVTGGPEGACVEICGTCEAQINAAPEPDHWRALASTMWSEDPATQVMAARMLSRLADQDWARDLAEQLWLDDDTRAWADNVPQASDHKDSNGVPLAQGDTVVLIKDLVVKGGGFTAKRGTAVHRISLVADNPAHIEGRIEGQRIVILTEFVKKR
jgi:protein PhnA